MTETSVADELRAGVEALTGDTPVWAPGTARITPNPAENELLISVCDQHDDPAAGARFDDFGHCGSCVFVRLHAGEHRFARQLAALINARESLADWLETEAHMCGVRPNHSAEGHTFHALKVARSILGTTGEEQ